MCRKCHKSNCLSNKINRKLKNVKNYWRRLKKKPKIYNQKLIIKVFFFHKN